MAWSTHGAIYTATLNVVTQDLSSPFIDQKYDKLIDWFWLFNVYLFRRLYVR